MTSTPSGTATVGTTVAVSGSSVCPSGSTAEYKFMIKPPSGATLLLRNWATGTTTSWDTTGLVAGVYKFRLFVRQVGSALTFEFEEKENITLTSP